MKKLLSTFLICCLSVLYSCPAFPRSLTTFDDQIQTINSNIEAQVFSVKKTKHYTAVEIGFTNMTDKYVEFTPQEIYLDDEVKYSLPLLTMEEIEEIQHHKPSNSIFPTALAVGLGIAALGTSRGNSDAAFGLGMAALGVGGAAVLTKGLENRSTNNKLIAFQNNKISEIGKLPPGITLGGILYFPPTKKPKSISIMTKTKNGSYERKVFYVGKK